MSTNYRAAQDVAFQLNISPSTLRRWSDEFAEFLSESASSLSGKVHRRYTDQDIERLRIAKDHIEDDLSYEQVRQKFREHLEMPQSGGALISGDAAASGAIMGYISETVENVRQGQMSVLNSQAANRELMGVVIQDNFNLKEENNRLRERMLDLERQMGDLRREEIARREALRQEFEMKLLDLRTTVNSVSASFQETMAAAYVAQDRPGCLPGIFSRRPRPTPDRATMPYNSPITSAAPPRPIPRPPGPPE